MPQAIDALRERMGIISGLNHAGAVLSWDQECYMPPGGVGSRARALGAVGRVAHELATSAEYGRLVAVTGDRVLVTTSQALVSADTNRLRDLYVKDVASGAVSSPLG